MKIVACNVLSILTYSTEASFELRLKEGFQGVWCSVLKHVRFLAENVEQKFQTLNILNDLGTQQKNS